MTDDRGRIRKCFQVGEIVRVLNGPFASFRGTVTEVDDEQCRLKVDVLIFGGIAADEFGFEEIEELKSERPMTV